MMLEYVFPIEGNSAHSFTSKENDKIGLLSKSTAIGLFSIAFLHTRPSDQHIAGTLS